MSKRGFFAGSQLVSKRPVSMIPGCGQCGLHKGCQSPKMPVTGEGRKGIFVLGEAPGETEDKENEQLVGKSGKYVRKVLRKFGVDLDRDCWKSNALICRPPKNRTPTENEIQWCRPNLTKAINELQPKVFICLGQPAVASLIGGIWRENVGPMTKWQGWRIPCQKLNAWICPTYHPAYCLREDDEVVYRVFEQAIQQAVELEDRPWKELPQEKNAVEIMTSTVEAVKALNEFNRRGGPVAFDYETNTLKPEHEKAQIVSCSVCWRGERTIAYPWTSATKKATRTLLRGRSTKIASNMKFEDRWTRRKLGTKVRNWYWDTMVQAHVLDNRKGITSIKFQSFVLLGSDVWDDHIQQFLHTTAEGSPINQILEEIELEDLLLYNGLDSLLEYRVAEMQLEALNYPKPGGMKDEKLRAIKGRDW